MINIILFNFAASGDVYFSQRVVTHLCNNNKDINFKIILKKYSYLFKFIKNLEIEEFSEQNKEFEKQNWENPYVKVDENTYAINLWVFGITKNWDKIVAIPEQIYKSVKININSMNDEYKINLNLPDVLPIELLPITPYTDISKFIEWYSNNNKEIIFYYNYMPLSGHTISVNNHNEAIFNLCNYYSNKIIIIPKINNELKSFIDKYNINNLIALDEKFGYFETPDGENLCKNTKIIAFCNYVISFDSGSCMNYIDYDISQSHVKIYHITLGPLYYNKLMQSVINITKKENTNNKYNCILAQNTLDFFVNIIKYIT